MVYYKKGVTYLASEKELGYLLEEGFEKITKKEYDNFIEETKRVFNNQDSSKSEKLQQIANLKTKLRNSDYQAIKYAEGWLTEQEYAPIKALRQSYREQINQLENEIEQENE